MRPFRNAWMLEEIGLPYVHRVCKPWSRVAKSVHPLGKVPALSVESVCDDNGGGDSEVDAAMENFVVVESAAINTFLGDLARELSYKTDAEHGNGDSLPILVPPPATPLRAKYDSLAMFVMTELDSQSLWIHRKHHDLSNVFGEAPTAVQEAKRQFDNALDAMVAEIISGETSNHSNVEEDTYLLPTGFSAADIVFANCCFWAQQNGWLERTIPNNDATAAPSEMQCENGDKTSMTAKPLSPELASYLKRCRSRPAFVRANEMRKNQGREEKESPISKL